MVRILNQDTRNFVVRSYDIEKIYKLLETEVGSTSISIECSDNIRRSFDSFNEFDNYDNSSNKSITDLSIYSYSKPFGNEKNELDKSIDSASVHFSSTGLISIYIEGVERDGTELRDRIGDIADGSKTWYGFITRILEPFYISVALSLIWGWSIYYYAQSNSTTESDSSPLPSLPVFILVSIVVILIICIPTVISFFGILGLQKWLFPVANFALGQGLTRYEHKEKIRWLFISTTLAMTIGSIWFILNKIT